MLKVFNMGMGFVLGVKEEDVRDVMGRLERDGEKG